MKSTESETKNLLPSFTPVYGSNQAASFHVPTHPPVTLRERDFRTLWQIIETPLTNSHAKARDIGLAIRAFDEIEAETPGSEPNLYYVAARYHRLLAYQRKMNRPCNQFRLFWEKITGSTGAPADDNNYEGPSPIV
jgi:hypothetical protein